MPTLKIKCSDCGSNEEVDIDKIYNKDKFYCSNCYEPLHHLLKKRKINRKPILNADEHKVLMEFQ